MKQNLYQIPTNLITGFLGVGKTTTMNALLQRKPAHERWAVLVNEFGNIGIDGDLLTADNHNNPSIFIQEVAGGCLCCTASVPMKVALNQLLREARPHRLLIEPTGLGHPQQIINALLHPEYENIINLMATITLVDARNIADDRYINHPIFNQQLEIADLIVAHKADLHVGGELESLNQYLELKQLQGVPVYPANRGNIEPVWLNLPHFRATSDSVATAVKGDFHSKGWSFDADICFDHSTIERIFGDIRAIRLKAIIHTERGLIAFNKVDQNLSSTRLEPFQHRTPDSKVEVIDVDGSSFQTLEVALNQARNRALLQR